MNCCDERSGVCFLHSDRFISGTLKASISRIATIRKPEELVIILIFLCTPKPYSN